MKIKLVENPDEIHYDSNYYDWEEDGYAFIAYVDSYGELDVMFGNNGESHSKMASGSLETIKKQYKKIYAGRIFDTPKANILSLWYKPDPYYNNSVLTDVKVLRFIIDYYKKNVSLNTKPFLYEIWEFGKGRSAFVPIDVLPSNMEKLKSVENYNKWKNRPQSKTKPKTFDFSYFKYKDMRKNPELYFNIKG